MQVKQLEFICSYVGRFIWLFFHLLFLDLEDCRVVVNFAEFELMLQSSDLKVKLGFASQFVSDHSAAHHPAYTIVTVPQLFLRIYIQAQIHFINY